MIDGAEKCILHSVPKPLNLITNTRLGKRRENLLRDFKQLAGTIFSIIENYKN